MADRCDMPLAGELDISDVDELRQASEFLRMWSRPGGNVTCLIEPAALGADPFLFGMAIVDAIRHGAKAYAHAVNISEEHAAARIREGFDAEMGEPTDLPRPLTGGTRH